MGISTIGQLAARSERSLIDHLGSMGSHLWHLANGQDDRTVVPDREAKSISTETTFGQDINDRDVLRACLLDLTDHLASRLRQAGVQARTVEVKIRSSDFRTQNRAQSLSEPTDVTDHLWKVAAELFERTLNRDLMPVRLLGVGASRLGCGEAIQGDLFDDGQRKRQGALDQVVDAIREQFGRGAIGRGKARDSRQSMD